MGKPHRAPHCQIAFASQPDFAPGTGWNYSDTNYILLGMIIEKVTHDSWENEVTRRIIGPLGLHHLRAGHQHRADGRTTVVLSVNSNVDDPVLAAECGLIDHVMCRHA